MAATDLIVPGENSTYLALKMGESDLTELIRENIGGEGISMHELDRVKVPSGGATNWEVPTLEGDTAMKEIEGIVIERATRRAYWPDKETTGEPPQCRSDDGVMGHGDPGLPCEECPFNEFGSADEGTGKACKETRQLFVLQPDSLIPIVVTVPPASLANVKAYFLRLLRAQLSPLDVVTVISLDKAENKAGQKYSKVTLAAGSRLSPEARTRMRSYANLIAPAMQASAHVEADEVNDEPTKE